MVSHSKIHPNLSWPRRKGPENKWMLQGTRFPMNWMRRKSLISVHWQRYKTKSLRSWGGGWKSPRSWVREWLRLFKQIITIMMMMMTATTTTTKKKKQIRITLMIITPSVHQLIPVPVPDGDTTPVMETLTNPLVRWNGSRERAWWRRVEGLGKREGNAMPAMLRGYMTEHGVACQGHASLKFWKSTMLQGIDPWVRAWL